MTPLPAELDVLEPGSRAAFWLAAAADDPRFMLARHTLHSRPPRKRQPAGRCPRCRPWPHRMQGRLVYFTGPR